MKKPPAVAMAILSYLGDRADSIVGDLVEEYRAGRSRLWFWRQAVSAVAFGVIRQIRHHPARAAGAVVTGWTVDRHLHAGRRSYGGWGRQASVELGSAGRIQRAAFVAPSHFAPAPVPFPIS